MSGYPCILRERSWPGHLFASQLNELVAAIARLRAGTTVAPDANTFSYGDFSFAFDTRFGPTRQFKSSNPSISLCKSVTNGFIVNQRGGWPTLLYLLYAKSHPSRSYSSKCAIHSYLPCARFSFNESNIGCCSSSLAVFLFSGSHWSIPEAKLRNSSFSSPASSVTVSTRLFPPTRSMRIIWSISLACK